MGAVTTKVSSFGRIRTTFYALLNFLKTEDGENLSVCDVGCLDGLHTLPFLKKGYKVDAFDMNMVYLYGGHVQLPIVKEDNSIVLQRRTIYGAEDRINIEELNNNVNLYSDNFFKCNTKKYDVIYSYRVLHREEYANIPMKDKIEALKEAVKEDGVLYLEYLMWKDDENNDNLNSDQYIKQLDMEKFFKEGWKILSIVEDRKCINEDPHIGNPTFHQHRVGMIKARKDKNYQPSYYKINLKF